MLQAVADLHPFFASLAVPLLLMAVSAELHRYFFGDKRGAPLVLWLLSGATLGVLGAFITGYVAQDFADRSFCVPDEPIAAHFFWARVFLISFVPLWCVFIAFRLAGHHDEAKRTSTVRDKTVPIAIILVLACGIWTATLGGRLVFKYGAGVDVANTSCQLKK